MAFQKARALQEAEKSVAQGKIAQAIRQYQLILDNDPSDVSLLNTVGDLYIRDRNITEGLRQFHRLAEAYVREGFNVKAIAIYRKISKVDPNSIETLLKLADLYQLQGLSREAREQYLQVAEFFKRRNQTDRVLEVLQKLVQLDPENLNFRNRLGAESEHAGKLAEAAIAYLETAEICLRRDDQAGAEPYLKKAAELDPKNSKIQILRARVAVARNQPEEAERIINSSPELHSDPAGKQILLDSYIGSHKIPEAANLALEVFHTNSADFTPVSTVSWLLAEKGDIDEAYNLVASVAESQIHQNHTGPLLEILHRIWTKAPNHIPTLELMHLVCEKTADESTLLQVLEALGHAHEEAGNMEKAEAAYQKLTKREPENENFLALLNAVRQKLGRAITPMDFSSTQVAMAEEDLPPEPEVIDADQELMVKEALENSDLFSRYNLTEKAIVELEKVLQFYPDQIEVHRRILEISRKGFPERGAIAAAQLARIFRKRGDEELANKYHSIATAGGTLPELPLPAPSPSNKVKEPAAPPPPAPAAAPMEFPISPFAVEEPVAAPETPPGTEFSFDVAPWGATGVETPAVPPPPQASPGQTMELDLSDDLNALTTADLEAPDVAASEPGAVASPRGEIPVPEEFAIPAETLALPPFAEMALPPGEKLDEVHAEPPPGPEQKAISADLDDSRIEVEFYLENGFVEEARQSVAKLEEKYPGSSFVAGLRQQLDAHLGKAPPTEAVEAVAPADESTVTNPVAEIGLDHQPTVEEPPLEISSAELSMAPAPEPVTETLAPPSLTEPQPATANAIPIYTSETEPAVEAPAVAAASGADLLGDLAGDLDSSLDGFAPSPSFPSAAPGAPPVEATTPPPDPSQGASQLSGLLAEMEDFDAASNRDDPETHYNLGVAFREMGLLDESIGEFQKVVRGAGKGKYPVNFLQACSLLAICFMEKRMPALAVRWYKRALETPDLDEEALMALQYDLGVAYEQSGDSRSALERFTEVYSQNIDFRDVAEKIRELQQKVG